MKQITLDYTTYQEELKLAKVEGFEIVIGLSKDLNNIIQDLVSHDSTKFHKAMDKLRKINYELNKAGK